MTVFMYPQHNGYNPCPSLYKRHLRWHISSSVSSHSIMSSTLTYPLPVLPSIPDDLEHLDSRYALPHLMALMKNTLVRGLNRVHACAPLVIVGHPALLPFLDYVRSLLAQLNLHLEEDSTFFSANALAEVATTETNPDTTTIRKSIISLTSLVSAWILVGISLPFHSQFITRKQDESNYCSSALCEGLSFGPPLVTVMQAQIRALTPTLLSPIISHLDLLELITGANLLIPVSRILKVWQPASVASVNTRI
jgi:hypothetical protein